MRGISWVLFCSLLVACSRGGTPPASDAPVAKPSLADQVATPSAAAGVVVGREVAGWRFDQRTLNAGTRSEYVDSSLQAGGKAVDPALAPLETPVGAFDLVERAWPPQSPQCWQPRAQGAISVSENGKALSEDELAAGRYAAAVGSKRPGTPANWCYSHAAKVWLSPAAAQLSAGSAGKAKTR